MSEIVTHNIIKPLPVATKLFRLIEDMGYIAGSAAAYMASPLADPVRPNDIDIFAVSPDAAIGIVGRLAEDYELQNENPICFILVPYAKSSSGDDSWQWNLPINVIKCRKAWHDMPMDMLMSFDLDISQAVMVGEDFILANTHVGSKEACILQVETPIRTVSRLVKYAARGVTFEPTQIAKIFEAWELLGMQQKLAQIELAKRTTNAMQNEDWVVFNENL